MTTSRAQRRRLIAQTTVRFTPTMRKAYDDWEWRLSQVSDRERTKRMSELSAAWREPLFRLWQEVADAAVWDRNYDPRVLGTAVWCESLSPNSSDRLCGLVDVHWDWFHLAVERRAVDVVIARTEFCRHYIPPDDAFIAKILESAPPMTDRQAELIASILFDEEGDDEVRREWKRVGMARRFA